MVTILQGSLQSNVLQIYIQYWDMNKLTVVFAKGTQKNTHADEIQSLLFPNSFTHIYPFNDGYRLNCQIIFHRKPNKNNLYIQRQIWLEHRDNEAIKSFQKATQLYFSHILV